MSIKCATTESGATTLWRLLRSSANKTKRVLNMGFNRNIASWPAATILTVAFFPASAFSVDSEMQMTGDQFSSACTRAEEAWVSFCNGYLQAVIDSIRESDAVCLPAGTTRTDLVTVAERDITASSHLRQMNAHDAVLTVLRRVYPC